MPQPDWISSWMCSNGPVIAFTTGYPFCDEGMYLVLGINFPECWNGTTLDSPDHMSHLAYASVPSLLRTYRTCPATHPVPIPALHMRVIYLTRGDPANVELSSGGVYSGHADFMNGWPAQKLQDLIEECLHTAKRCRG